MAQKPRDDVEYARLAAHLTPARCEALLRDGYCVIDAFWGADWAAALRSELLALAAAGSLAPNRTYFARPDGGRHLFSKPHVFEADLHQARRRRGRASCGAQDAVADAAKRRHSRSFGRGSQTTCVSWAAGSTAPRARSRTRCARRCRSWRCAAATMPAR